MLRRAHFLWPLLLAATLMPGAYSQTAPPQDIPITQTPPTPSDQTQAPGESTQDDTNAGKKPSKVKRKLREAVPDCINIIFSKCWHNDAREQEAEGKDAAMRAHAIERCKAIDAARAQRKTPVPTPVMPAGESSSRASSSVSVNPASCTPEDVLEAEHDVDVGDFNLHDKNYKGAEMRYRDALKALPEDPVASLHLARLLEKTGQKAEAVDMYRSYMSWNPTGKDAEEAQRALARLQPQNP